MRTTQLGKKNWNLSYDLIKFIKNMGSVGQEIFATLN